MEGSYNGSSNGRLVFVPSGDGQIGVTHDLHVNVLDERGSLVTTLDVGAGYDPGKAAGPRQRPQRVVRPRLRLRQQRQTCSRPTCWPTATTTDVLVRAGHELVLPTAAAPPTSP